MEEDIDDIDDVFGGAPDEEKSGITGNEGAYLQYWYFRAAVLFWPTSRFLGSLTISSLFNNYLRYLPSRGRSFCLRGKEWFESFDKSD
mmetsp:Transcript_17215/g.39923  ORF Transcript_17215/g.39923 Transcript_17215/m.39923 type:complete len:88 (+) Transcript_17215:736-999(+)